MAIKLRRQHKTRYSFTNFSTVRDGKVLQDSYVGIYNLRKHQNQKSILYSVDINASITSFLAQFYYYKFSLQTWAMHMATYWQMR